MAFPLDTNISLSSISQLVFTKWLSTLSPLLCLLFLAQFIAICLNTSLKQFSPVSSDLPDTKLMDIFPNLLISQIHWSLLTTPPILPKALPPSFNPTARVFSCPFSFSFASFSFPWHLNVDIDYGSDLSPFIFSHYTFPWWCVIEMSISMSCVFPVQMPLLICILHHPTNITYLLKDEYLSIYIKPYFFLFLWPHLRERVLATHCHKFESHPDFFHHTYWYYVTTLQSFLIALSSSSRLLNFSHDVFSQPLKTHSFLLLFDYLAIIDI